MRTKHLLLYTTAALLLLISACSDKYDLPSQPLSNYIKVYMPQAVNDPRNITLKITDSLQPIIYSASYGGPDLPAQDIPVNFSVNYQLVDSFNTANSTSYAPLPDSTFTLEKTSAVIPAGQLSTGPLKLIVKTNGPKSMPALKYFLLPISINIPKSTVKLNTSLQTSFFVITAQPDFADYPNFDRTNWSIAGFSSQEAVGEGPNNGRAVFAIDGNPATYWHSQWMNGQPGPPHYITVDMGAVTTLHGLAFLDRQSNNDGKPNLVNIQTSIDGSAWEDAGSFNLSNTQALQKHFLSEFKQARFFKVNILSSYNATYVHLAELNAF